MKSWSNLKDHPASLPLAADDIVEFHAARILLLIRRCGTGDTINGLTKMAKLDFFVRYPIFFQEACSALGRDTKQPTQATTIESSMVRHHYGPWDKRYYHILAYLKSRGLLITEKEGKTVKLRLSGLGRQMADNLCEAPEFDPLIDQICEVGKVLGSKSGTQLKNLIYRLFKEEVAQRPLGEVIKNGR